jgi:hypothetical protein
MNENGIGSQKTKDSTTLIYLKIHLIGNLKRLNSRTGQIKSLQKTSDSTTFNWYVETEQILVCV